MNKRIKKKMRCRKLTKAIILHNLTSEATPYKGRWLKYVKKHAYRALPLLEHSYVHDQVAYDRIQRNVRRDDYEF